MKHIKKFNEFLNESKYTSFKNMDGSDAEIGSYETYDKRYWRNVPNGFKKEIDKIGKENAGWFYVDPYFDIPDLESLANLNSIEYVTVYGDDDTDGGIVFDYTELKES